MYPDGVVGDTDPSINPLLDTVLINSAGILADNNHWMTPTKPCQSLFATDIACTMRLPICLPYHLARYKMLRIPFVATMAVLSGICNGVVGQIN